MPGLAASLVTGRRRSFGREARLWAARLRPPLRVIGDLPELERSGWVLLTNHFARPGFRAWWIALAVSSILPREVHWVTTSALTFPDAWRRAWLTPLSSFVLRRAGRVYGFTAMPPMPPCLDDVAARARAVRRVLDFAERAPHPLIGLAPEGGDAAGGILQRLWPGTGRFLLHLAARGLRFLPFGVYESADRLCLTIGEPFDLAPTAGHSDDRDARAASLAARALAACLPLALRGALA